MRPLHLPVARISSYARGLMSKAPHSKRESQQGYLTALLVVVVSVGLGLFGLPRLSRRAAHSDSPLIGRPAPDFMLRTLSEGGLGTRPAALGFAGKNRGFGLFCQLVRSLPRAGADRRARGASLVGAEARRVRREHQRRAGATAQRYLDAHPPSYPVLFDRDAEAANAFDVSGLPTLLVIDKQGIVRAVEMGVVGESELEGLIRDADNSEQ